MNRILLIFLAFLCANVAGANIATNIAIDSDDKLDLAVKKELEKYSADSIECKDRAIKKSKKENKKAEILGDKEIICHLKNMEISKDVISKDSTYIFRASKSKSKLNITHFIESNNFIYEGYNLSNLLPKNIQCLYDNELVKLQNMILYNILCDLDSNIYKLNITLHFKVFHPDFSSLNDILDAMNIDSSEVYEATNPDFIFEIINITLRLKSNGINAALFDLYKREQRIANTENAQDDKDYLATDDVLFADYKAFLQGYYTLVDGDFGKDSKDSNAELLESKDNKITNLKAKKTLNNIIGAFIELATKPNITLNIKITNPHKFQISLSELQAIADINELFLPTIAKILQDLNVEIKTQG